jgi:superfamily II DNA helicase RecQ
MALTATANKRTQDDIIMRLKLRNPVSLEQSFNRPNLTYTIVPKKKGILDEIVTFINSKHRNKTGIIYCISRQKCENVARDLSRKGLKAKHFHAGMDVQDKERTLADWQEDRCRIIVATVSHG